MDITPRGFLIAVVVLVVVALGISMLMGDMWIVSAPERGSRP